MKCPNCGSPVDYNSQDCFNCGASLQAADIQLKPGEKTKKTNPLGSVVNKENNLETFVTYSEEAHEATVETTETIPLAIVVPQSHDGLNTPPIRRNGFFLFVGSFIPALLSIGITLVLSFLLLSFSKEGFYFRRVITPEGGLLAKTIPFATIVLFFWSLIDLYLKYRRSRQEEKIFQIQLVQTLPKTLTKENVKETILQLERHLPAQVIQRIITSSQRVFLMRDAREEREVIRQQTELEFDSNNAKYTTLRLFIWAMPILGFIGTVLGIGWAMGNFSGFLSSDLEVETIKSELSKVAQGLSLAFDTTLLGLVCSLLAMVGATYMRKRDEQLITDAEIYCLAILDNHARNGKINSHPELASIAEIVDLVKNDAKSALDGITTIFHNAGQEIALASTNLTNAFSGSGRKIAETAIFISEELNSGVSEMKATIEDLKAKSNAIRDGVKTISDDFSYINDLSGKASELQGKYEELTGLTRQLTELTEKLSSHIQPLNDVKDIYGQSVDVLNNLNVVLSGLKTSQEETTSLMKQLTGGINLKFTSM